jgi:hypothetical protein
LNLDRAPACNPNYLASTGGAANQIHTKARKPQPLRKKRQKSLIGPPIDRRRGQSDLDRSIMKSENRVPLRARLHTNRDCTAIRHIARELFRGIHSAAG